MVDGSNVVKSQEPSWKTEARKRFMNARGILGDKVSGALLPLGICTPHALRWALGRKVVERILSRHCLRLDTRICVGRWLSAVYGIDSSTFVVGYQDGGYSRFEMVVAIAFLDAWIESGIQPDAEFTLKYQYHLDHGVIGVNEERFYLLDLPTLERNPILRLEELGYRIKDLDGVTFFSPIALVTADDVGICVRSFGGHKLYSKAISLGYSEFGTAFRSEKVLERVRIDSVSRWRLVGE